jgi:hypothetical protein
MGMLVNRGLSSAAALALIFVAAISCSDNSVTGPNGLTTDGISADDGRVIATVQVSLAATTLTVGQTTRASVVFLDKYGNTLTRTVGWSSSAPTVASVSATGVVTALTAGTASIIATHNGHTGSATLTVTGTGSTPPPPPAGGVNEPSGMTLISDRAFNSLNESSMWEDENPAVIVSDATAPASPSKIWRAVYPKGFVGGSGPANSWLYMPRKRTVYVRWYFKYSSNWYGNTASGINKMFYVWTGGKIPTMVIEASGSGTGPLKLRMAGQEIVKGGSGYGDASNPDWPQNLRPGFEISRGQWHKAAILLVGNTSGTANGSFDAWIDGNHLTHFTNIQFVSGDALWGDINVDPVYGGGASVVPATQTWDLDDFYISGTN